MGANDTIAHLEQAVEDAPDNGKIIFAGHRGCGKSTLLAKFSDKMRKQGYFVAFFSVADLIEMSDVNHVNILYAFASGVGAAIALTLLNKANEYGLEIPEDTKKALLEWFSTTHTETVTNDLKKDKGKKHPYLQHYMTVWQKHMNNVMTVLKTANWQFRRMKRQLLYKNNWG